MVPVVAAVLAESMGTMANASIPSSLSFGSRKSSDEEIQAEGVLDHK